MADPRFESEPRPLIGVAERHATAAATTLTVRIAVTNAAAAPRALSVTAVGVDATWTEGPARTGVLEPGGTDVVELRITPPQGTLPASYPLVIAVQALDPETGAPTAPIPGTAETVLVVNPRSQLSLEVMPRQLSLIATKRFTVELRNTGAAPAKVKLLLKSGTHVAFSLARQEVEVRPGAVVKVRGRARAKRPATIGPRMVHNFTLTARGTETMKHVEGHVVQKPMISTGILKIVGLALVLAVWVAAAVVFIPTLADRVQTSSQEQAAETAPGADAADEGADDPAAEGGDDGGGEDGGDGGDGEGDEAAEGLLLSGNVTGDSPADTNVHLQRISLVSEAVEGATGVGVPADEIGGTGLRPMAAMTAAPVDETDLSVISKEDGSWSFPPVPPRGYYLVEFTKPGFQTERYVVDSSSAAAAEPLEVDLVPGEGSLAGRVVDRAGKPVGGASITVSDGTHTITTTSNSEDSTGGATGTWEIQGLSTPSTYVVSATKYAMSSEARVVDVAAGGAGRADLTLVPGVAALSGRVRGAGSGDQGWLSDVTVTVTGTEGLVRATTTLSALEVRGRYTLPALPSPGTYSVTASRNGYQSETLPLSLDKGQAQRTDFDFQLSRDTGTLTGFVTEPTSAATARSAATTTARRKAAAGPVVTSAGLTLSNADHTYKSMSGTQGEYGMAGITPGDYILATEFYGKTTSYQNITIKAGESKALNVSLTDAPGGGLATTASIRGSVIDATTGEQLTAACATPETACLTASVTPQTVEGAASRAAITTSFAAADGFALGQGADGLQLGPGLHRVTVRAPGYEAGTVDVRVVAGVQTEAPLVEMYPAPEITGIVTAGAGDDAHPVSCVWVFQGSVAPDQLKDRAPTCANPTAAPCQAGTSSYDGQTSSGTWCALSDDDTGEYTVQVPAQGAYTVYVQPAAPEYIPTAPRSVTIARAERFEYNPIVDRYGEIALTVTAPNDNGVDDNLVPVPVGTEVKVTPKRETPGTITTGPAGEVMVSGLLDGQNYTFSAQVQRSVPGEGTTKTVLMGSATGSSRTNDQTSLRLQLVDPVPGFVGRVTSTLNDKAKPLDGIQVSLDAAESYTPAGSVVYDQAMKPTTDDLGCFAVKSAGTPARSGTCEAGSLTGSDTWGGAMADRWVATNQIRKITITKPGFDDGVWNYRQLSTLQVNEFTLDPTPVPFAVSLGLNPSTPGLDATVDWGGTQTPGDSTDDVTATVTQRPSRTSPTAGVVPGTTANTGQLTWSDLQIDGPAGTPLIRPGRYLVDIKVPGSYSTPTNTWLNCTASDGVVVGTCTWEATGTSQLLLQQRGDLTISVKGSDNKILPATVKLTGGPSLEGATLGGATNDSGTITFTRLAVQTITDPVVEIAKAAGYLSGSTADADARRPVLTCDGATTPATSIPIRAGSTTACTLTMRHLLPTISGTLKGILGPETDPVTADPAGIDYLANQTVRLQRCTTSDCSAIEFAMTQTTSLADAANTAHPNGARFSFAGTATNEFKPGTYLLSVPDVPAGYVAPQLNPLHATKVQVTATEGDVEADAFVWAKPVSVDVRLVDQHGAPVDDATVYAHRRDVSSPGLATDTQSVAVGGTNRYPLAGLVPGRTVFWVTGPGLAPQGQAQKVLAQPTGSGQRLDLVVARDGQQVDGTVETTVSSVTSTLAGVKVTLTCAPSTSTPAAFCPAGQPALGTDRQPLVATSDASGHYVFTSVPAGTFTATFSKQGYLTAALPSDVVVLPSPRTPDGLLTLPRMNIKGVARDVTVSVTSTHPDPASDIGPVTVTLVGVHGTPSTYTYTATSRVAGAWTATLPQVRWGCYDVQVTTDPAWQGVPDGPTGSPTQPSLSCGDADLVVPDTSDDPITLSYVLHGGRMGWTFTVSTWPGHRLPPVTLKATNGTLTRTFSTASTGGATATTGGAFLPDGEWKVTAVIPDEDKPYWAITPEQTVTVRDGQDVSLPVTLTEATFSVKIRMPSVPDADIGTAQVLVSGGDGQPGDDPAPSVITVPASREVTLLLPRGPWQFEGSWSTSPLPTTYTVSAGTTDRVIVLGPDTPPPTPTPTDDPTP